MTPERAMASAKATIICPEGHRHEERLTPPTGPHIFGTEEGWIEWDYTCSDCGTEFSFRFRIPKRDQATRQFERMTIDFHPSDAP